MFTTSPVLAQKLDSIFAGNANVCYNATGTKPVNTVLGSRSVPNNDVWLYVDGTYIGTSCWIYAIGVYFTLFGEGTRGSAGPNSEEVTAAEGYRVSYDNFVEWGVRPGVGALIRIGTHSIVLLGYDEEKIAYVDGNGDGRGLVAVRIEPWSNLCSNLRSSIQFLIQPKASHFDALYGTPSPDEFLLIQKTYPAHSEFTANADTQIMSMPCSSETSAASVVLSAVAAGEALAAYRLVQNENGDYWYQVTTADGQPGYVPAAQLSWVKALADQDDVTISGQTDPPDMKIGSRYTIRGTISSKYSKVTEVSVSVYRGSDTSGTPATGASDNVSNNSYSLADSRIDMNTSFGKLSVGKHTYVVTAAYRNYYLTEQNTVDYHTGTVTVQRSTFWITDPNHSHSWNTTSDEEFHWKACSCGEAGEKSAHEFSDWAEATPPSYTNPGTETQTCSICDYTATRPLDKLVLSVPEVSISAAKSCQSVTLSWSAVQGAEMYEIWRILGDEVEYQPIFSTSETQFSYTAERVGETCQLKVRAIAGNERGAYSEPVSYTNACASYVTEEAAGPTCTQAGKTEGVYCPDCGVYTVVPEPIPFPGHSFLDGFCSVCGQAETFYLLGDVNLDGFIDSMDTNVLFRYANEDATLTELTDLQLILADVNQDGTVDSMDTNVLFRFANEDRTLSWVPTEVLPPRFAS